MNTKTCLTIFIGLLAINVSTQSPTKQVGGGKDVLADIAEKLVQSGLNTLNKLDTFLDNFNPENFGDNVVAELVKEITSVYHIIFKLIDQLAEGATEDGKSVLKCFDAQEATIDTTIAKLLKDLANCGLKESDKIVAEIKSAVKFIRDVLNDVEDQIKELKSCTGDDKKCLESFVEDIAKVGKKIPAALEQELQKIKQLIKDVLKDVDACETTAVSGIRGTILELFNGFATCIRS